MVPLLIDTMVNGSAINYNTSLSTTSIKHENENLLRITNIQSEIDVIGE